MNSDYFSIGVDTSYTPLSTSESSYRTPENIRDVPCNTCALAGNCEEKRQECVAARVWYASGDYKNEDVTRLLRGIKQQW